MNEEFDVIVVGAGNAALAAAVSAKENGADRVVVLEKAPREMRGGNTHWSGGVLRFAYDEPREIGALLPGIEDEFENFYDGISPYTQEDFHGDLVRVTNGRTDPTLSRLLVSNSQATVRWMKDTGGIKMEPAISLSAVKKDNVMVWARGLVVRAAHEGVGLSRSWFSTCERMGIEIRYGNAVSELLVDDNGRVVGVKTKDDEGVRSLGAKAVVLGCGGFEANVQMRTQHIGPLVGAAKVRGTPHNQGDGLRMALAIGAMPWGQWSGCHATPISADWGDFAPREMTDRSNRLSYVYSVMINRKGKRFVDEGEDGALFTYAKFGRAILAEPGAKAYQLFDSKVIHLLEPRYSTSDPIKANSLADLIEQLDIDDKAQALRTVQQFNDHARAPDEGFDPTKKDGVSTKGLDLEKTNWALKLDKPPYYAYSATGGITFTFGGLKINENAEVIGTDWRPIKGLYCCGELVGGLFYDNYPAGTGLVSGATFGRIAGRNAAAQQGVAPVAAVASR
ncbi:FAD-dependent tricarballylate dehydrogenase TcuA [Bradyrhizobium liaoningense]|uniref:FAD-dependent tricarballylate dehydrogenase TcuA n=1 Tax=Bradyrhizobium liaoningense TaxID=43992 RepID=UPI001BACCA7B|nr:FAD-dependent tricarballylate dehydrogenase TcuA [Bradyrhizobium liaoningense]MBR0706321.1 FAD-dependent tricarballylate dehydrogenase TcuA [Bradyrhizobium liaoningense]